jgi:hypothetical protein
MSEGGFAPKVGFEPESRFLNQKSLWKIATRQAKARPGACWRSGPVRHRCLATVL